MRILGAYFRRHWKLLFLLAGCLGICSAVFYLYGLPLESVGYAFVLCFSLGLALFAVGYVQFLRRHRELERLLVAVGRYANTSSEARYYSDFAHWNLDRARARSLTRWFVPAPESERNFLW